MGREPLPPCDHHCEVCGKHETGNWRHLGLGVDKPHCFGCYHYLDCLAMHEQKGGFFRTEDGAIYLIGEDRPNLPRFMKGFGGAKFRITYSDGSVVETDNLWHTGDKAHVSILEQFPLCKRESMRR